MKYVFWKCRTCGLNLQFVSRLTFKRVDFTKTSTNNPNLCHLHRLFQNRMQKCVMRRDPCVIHSLTLPSLQPDDHPRELYYYVQRTAAVQLRFRSR